MSRYLTERGFANTPPLLGEVTRFEPDGTPYTMVLMQGFMRNQGDGWGWTLDFLSRLLNSTEIVDPETQIEPIADAMGAYGNFAAALGRRLAELHAVFAIRPTSRPSRRRRRRRPILQPGPAASERSWRRRWRHWPGWRHGPTRRPPRRRPS